MASDVAPVHALWAWPQHGFTSLKKLRPQSVTSRIQPGSDVIVCAEMDEQWGYVGAKSRQRWLFYAYDRIRRTVVAHAFGERTLATLERLLSLLSAFEVVVWMTDGWPLYESRLKGKLHVISKRYTQRIERHNLNLRQHLARLGRKSLSFSKSVELHDKVIGHYLGHQRYLCSHCRKTWQLQFTYTASQPGTHQKIIDMAMNGVGCRASARIMGVGLNTVLRHLKNSGRSR
ncbi:putative transposase [Shigella flexneri 1485-80]|nr:putative transposase [Shigella flexneri 1485-80]